VEELAYLNGTFCPLDEAKISINDRGLLFADSVYEVLPAYNGKPFRIKEHFERLRRSLKAVRLDVDPQAMQFEAVIMEGLKRCGFDRALVYLQITRGVARRSHLPAEGLKPTIIMTFRQMATLSPEVRTQGITVCTTPEIRWANCFIKATTLLPNVLTKMQAREMGFDDAIFVTADGEVREATAANVVAVCDGRLYYPSCDHSILHGVTLMVITQCAEKLDIAIEEAPLSIARLRNCDELFLTNVSEEVVPVTRLDSEPIGDGRVGPITRKLMDTYHALVLKKIVGSSSLTTVQARG